MPWIRTIPPGEAGGLLKRLYDAAVERAGKIFGIVRIFSLRPAALRDSIALYRSVMFGPSALSRAEREMIAVLTSRINDCHY